MRYNKALNQYARQDVPRDFDYIYTILSMISGQIKTKNTVNHSLLQSLPVKNFSSNQFGTECNHVVIIDLTLFI